MKKIVWLSFLLLQSLSTISALKQPQLINIKKINPSIIIDLFLADPHNFLKKAFYPSNAKAYIDRDVAYILDAIQKELAQKGLGLKIKDAYRPFAVQKALWDIVQTMNLANPGDYISDPVVEGGRHPRGIAVDVTLIRLSDQQELPMPPMGFTEKAHHGYTEGLTDEQIANRDFLKNIMIKHGFANIRCEWWHYNLPNWRDFQALDISFDELEKSVQ